MKVLKLLFTSSLWMLFCIVLFSCAKDSDVESPALTSDSGIDKVFANYGIADFKNIEMLSCRIYETNKGHEWGTANFVGLRNNHLWIASFDRETKQKMVEWTDSEYFDRTPTKHMGYGEYKEFKIDEIHLVETFCKNDSSVSSVFLQGNDYSEGVYIFKTPKCVKKLNVGPCPWSILGPYPWSIVKWYNQSVFIGRCCYTMAGDTIYVAKESMILPHESDLATTVSYKETIFTHRNSFDQKFYVDKKNWETGLNEWSIEVPELSKEPEDAKIAVSIVDNSTYIWKYKADITRYDGSKKTLFFSVNIRDRILL